MTAERKPEFPNSLTPQQESVLSLMVNGYLNSEIAQNLGIPESEVKDCVVSIIKKLKVESAGQVATLYLQSKNNPDSQPSQVPNPLTPRQIEVLEFVAMGFSNLEIAERLIISPRSVQNDFSRQISDKKRTVLGVSVKLNVSSRREAVVKAIDLGLLDPLKLVRKKELERVKRLTQREIEILKHLSDPSSQPAFSPTWIIGHNLEVSKRTVQRDLVSIYHKLGIQVTQRSTGALTRAVVIFSAYQKKVVHEAKR